MEIKGEKYRVWYERKTSTVHFVGSLRLNGRDDYAVIAQLLKEAAIQETQSLILDLQNLEFLNSSGINMLSKFVIDQRKNNQIHLIIRGSTAIPWHSKSLKNLQRLMPSISLKID